jgi:hypothetical protein
LRGMPLSIAEGCIQALCLGRFRRKYGHK